MADPISLDHLEADKNYNDLLASASQLREELRYTDHDCRAKDPYDACTFCGWLYSEATDSEIVVKCLEAREKGWL